MASRIKRILTIEENVLAGGFGSAVLEYLNSRDIPDIKIKILGIPDEFVEQGSQAILRKNTGLMKKGFIKPARHFSQRLQRFVELSSVFFLKQYFVRLNPFPFVLTDSILLQNPC